METIWHFNTARFSVNVSAEPDYDIDLSWDDDGSVQEGLNTGKYISFQVAARVYLDGNEIAADYLGGCIYESIEEFRDHLGRNKQGYGSYFSDMVRSAVSDARKHLCNVPKLRCA